MLFLTGVECPISIGWQEEKNRIGITLSSLATLFAAGAPQAMKTIPRLTPLVSPKFEPPYLSTTSMTLSVNVSQPLLECDAALPQRTVSAVFKSKTPNFAQALRFLMIWVVSQYRTQMQDWRMYNNQGAVVR